MTGYPGWLTCRFLETLQDYSTVFSSLRCLVHPDFYSPTFSQGKWECVSGDLLDPPSLDEAVKGCDVILHAAGVIHVRKPRDFYRVNRDGTRHLLEAAVKAGVSKFIYISSNAAQGFCEGRGHALDEMAPCHPVSHYGKSKRQGEEAVEAYQRSGKIQTVILRPAMFYGPPVPLRHLDIYKKVQKGTFPVFGTGDYLRSVTYIDHLIQAIHLTIQKPEAYGKTYTIVDREIPTLREMIFDMALALGVPVKIIRYPKWMAQAAEFLDHVLESLGIYWMLPHIVGEAHKHIAYKITRAEQELGYRPHTNYREGCQRAVDWCFEKGLLKKTKGLKKRAVFLDRDGVLVKEMTREGKCYTPLSLEEMDIMPGVRETAKTLQAHGFLVFIVTNQPDVARKKLNPGVLQKMNQKLRQAMGGKKNVHAIYVCPHDNSDECSCRKPKPGMLFQAAAEWGINLKQSFFIGDHARDMGAGKAAGCRTLLLRKPYNQDVPADEILESLQDVVRYIIATGSET